jgi:Double zinc ribbon
MCVIPTVWCPYCDSANELNSKRCWRCRQRIPAGAEWTGVGEETMLPVPVAALPVPAAAAAGLPPIAWDVYPAGLAAAGFGSMAEVQRKQCVYCREWIDPEASVCPYCRTDQGPIAAVQRATWSFIQLFLCFAALGVGVVALVRLWHWGMMGGLGAMVGRI